MRQRNQSTRCGVILLSAMGLLVPLTVTTAFAQSSSSQNSSAPQPNSPYTEMREVPRAAAAAAGARAQYRKTQSQINHAILDLQMDLEQSEAWRAATLALDGAHRDYNHARIRVLTQLEKDPAYQRASATADAYATMIAELKQTPKPDQRTLLELAKQRLSARMTVNQMEADALAKDAVFQKTREVLIDRNDQVLGMRRELTRSIRKDPQWQEARAAMLDARVNIAASAAYLRGAIEARNIAVDFATYQVQQLRYQPVITGYDDTGYGIWTTPYRFGYPMGWQSR